MCEISRTCMYILPISNHSSNNWSTTRDQVRAIVGRQYSCLFFRHHAHFPRLRHLLIEIWLASSASNVDLTQTQVTDCSNWRYTVESSHWNEGYHHLHASIILPSTLLARAPRRTSCSSRYVLSTNTLKLWWVLSTVRSSGVLSSEVSMTVEQSPRSMRKRMRCWSKDVRCDIFK